MAVERTGSVTTITSAANSGSQSVTVPADAELAVVAIGGYRPEANYFSAGAVTLGGEALSVAVDGDNTTSETMLVMFRRVNPLTGSRTLAWDWVGTNSPEAGVVLHVAFYKGLDTSDPIRWTGVNQGGTSLAATAVSGDLVAAVGASEDATNRTWTNATEIAETLFNSTRVSYAEALPSGDVTVSYDGVSFPAIGALTIRQSAALADPHVFFDITDLPGDFGNAETAEIVVRTRGVDIGATPLKLFAQIFQSDEITPLTDEVLCREETADSAFANFTVPFTGVEPLADKTVWDNARVRFRWGNIADTPINDSGFTTGFTKGFEA